MKIKNKIILYNPVNPVKIKKWKKKISLSKSMGLA